MLVLFGHLCGTRGFFPYSVYERVGDVANLGVRVFFVISGFLITSLLLKEVDRTGTISPKMFYFRRTMRIFPVAYCFIAVVALLSAIGIGDASRRDFLFGLTYTANYNGGRAGWSLGHLWSLAVEEQFYLAWPATLALLGRKRSLHLAAWILASQPVIVILWTAAERYRNVIGVFIDQRWQFDPGRLPSRGLRAGTPEQPTLPKRPSFEMVLRRTSPRVCPELSAPLLMVVHHLFATDQHRHCRLRAPMGSFPDDLVARFLNMRPVCYLGVISYSLYLWQQLFLNRGSAVFLTSFPANVIFAGFAAILSYRLVESPFLRLRTHLEGIWFRPDRRSPRMVARRATR
jgi:peptidoglycan/LPS O-acetylase OafA/YrhL